MYQRKRVTASGLSKNPKAIAAIAACLVIVIVAVVLVVALSGKDKGKDPDITKQPQKTTEEQTSETTTEAPKPVGGEVPYLAWEEAQKKNPNYFNEAVFIGDSTGLKIMMYDGIEISLLRKLRHNKRARPEHGNRPERLAGRDLEAARRPNPCLHHARHERLKPRRC